MSNNGQTACVVLLVIVVLVEGNSVDVFQPNQTVNATDEFQPNQTVSKIDELQRNLSVSDIAGWYDFCTQNSDCKNEHRVCWHFNECGHSRCLCEENYFPVNKTTCLPLPKYGETKCTSSEECGIRGGVCRSGLCVCSKGDDYISDDRTQCNRLKDESCFKDDHCQFPLKCIANTCNCSALEYHVPTRINHIYPASRCINISLTALKVYEVCKVEDDICENSLTCYRCEENVDAICISELIRVDQTGSKVEWGDFCETSADCKFEGGVCWYFKECGYAKCLCDDNYFPIESNKCAPLPKYGETKCITSEECGLPEKGAICRKGVCVCIEGDDYMSEDRTQCNRFSEESCYKNDQCQFPMNCTFRTCSCPSWTFHVNTRINYTYTATRCIINYGTPLQANDICEEDDDICDDKLTCYRCEENVDAVCLSELIKDYRPPFRALWGDFCTQNADCHNEHGVCWHFKECGYSRCLCEDNYYASSYERCVPLPKYGETKCKTKNDCGIDIADCRNGTCQCSRGNAYVSHDKTKCHRKKNEFCSKDYECQYPLTCVNETCNCPPNTFHVSYNDDSELVHRCIPNVVRPLQATEPCDSDYRLCGNKLKCMNCTEDTIRICVSEKIRVPTNDTDKLYDHCTHSSDCNYAGGVCWYYIECEYGVCLCEEHYYPVGTNQCKPLPKYGESACKNDDDCGIYQAACMYGVCGCSQGDDYMSENRTYCHRVKDESCFKNDQCQHPLKCIDDICDCPSNTSHITTLTNIGRLGMKYVSRCIPNSEKVLKRNQVCNVDDDYCDSGLICHQCKKNGDSVCISELITIEEAQALFLKNGDDQVTMNERIISYISLFATVVVMLY